MNRTTTMSDMLVIENFINGEFVPTKSHIDSFDPSTGSVWAKIPDSDETDINKAVDAAKKAFQKWSSTPVQERSRIMLKIADRLETQLQSFAEQESHDQGKPIWLAKAVDIPRAVHNIRTFATSILHDTNKSSVMDGVDAFNYTIKHPVGVAGLISPWNLPLYLLTFKLAPAIAAGNTVVAKPSEMTSVTAWMLAKIFNECGLPPGVVNLVFGVGPKAGEAIVKHPDIPLVSFTGGTATAKRLRASAAPFCKKLSLELGGKNPAVIFNDADLDKCIPTTVRSSFINQGEICLCTSRIYVQRELYPRFLERFSEETRKLVVGDPKDDKSILGALISKEHLAKVKGYVEVAEKEGATILCGKEDMNLQDKNKQGYFMRPTIVTDVSDDSRLIKEEIFGPVTCVMPFDTEEEVIQRANDVQYGLCATVWTTNASVLHRVSRALQVGTVWANCWLVRDLNMPFGGMKDSGIGREGTTDSMEFFMEQKTVCVKL
ncbi:2-aminomuconic semialdehyde dehydrogenase-like [Mytilus trossulus]|uniref:2-aminomuconic semialdehyde dehydrogenase-like n=1 Tax=Mytilus trossulus TaxID=6551 RepID=UPI0030067BFF